MKSSSSARKTAGRTIGTAILLVFLTTLVAGCSRLHFARKYESGAEITQFATFSLKQGSTRDLPVFKLTVPTDQLLRDRLAVALVSRGFSPAPENDQGLMVLYGLEEARDPHLTDEETQFQKGTSGSNFPEADPRGRGYLSQTLVVEVLAPSSSGRDVVWRGTARGVTDEARDRGESILLAADTLLQDFPSRVASQ